MIDWLDQDIKTTPCGDTLYPLESAKEKYEVIKLGFGGYLVINNEDDLWIKFAVLTFSESDDKNTLLSCIFHGEGPSDSLRECRHTWWGNKDGYVFYPDGRIISTAFNELSNYFDQMSKEDK